MRIGLVGLQYSGKTTLFQTLSGNLSANISGSEEAVIETMKVPDERLDKLTSIFNPKKQVNATIEIFDFPGLRMGDDGKVKITNTFLSSVRNNEALFFVVRHFNEDSVPHPMGNIDAIRDIQFLETEFLLSDMAFFESRLEKLRKDLKKLQTDAIKRELPLAEKCLAHLEQEQPLRNLELDENERKLLAGYQLLTLKPIAIAVNFDDQSVGGADAEIEKIRAKLGTSSPEIVPFFAKIELELAGLAEEERNIFMEEYGVNESALSKILRLSYQILGLQSFFTVGEDECRAWTVKKNATAQEAAGAIHSDFYDRFIRAEVVHYNDFINHGSFPKCKEAGVWRLEGKEYRVSDGDILNIRHN